MTTALLSLGSNMGEPRRYLADAVATLGPVVQRVSSVYRTPPWGPVAQDDFLNIAVLVGDDATDAPGWWLRAQQLEQHAQRRRDIRWGPRTLDVDVVMVWHAVDEASGGGSGSRDGSGGSDSRDGSDDSDGSGERGPGGRGHGPDPDPILSNDPRLTLPHPRAHERGFVLVPWAEVQPDAHLPGHGPVAALLGGIDTSRIVRIGSLEY